MKIPLGNFGTTTPGRVSPGTAGGDFGQGVGQAVQRLGQTITGVMDQREQEKNALARAKALNEGYRHELYAMEQLRDVDTEIRHGKINYRDAPTYFQNKMDAFPRQPIDGLDPVAIEGMDGKFARTVASYKTKVKELELDYERKDYSNQFYQGVETLNNQARMPGADVDEINSKYPVLGHLAKMANIDEARASQIIRDSQEKNLYDNISERGIRAEAMNDVAALQQLKFDITDEKGRYTGRLDSGRRNTLLNGIYSSLRGIEYKQTAEAAKREAKAQAVFNLFSGVYAKGGTPSPALKELTEAAVRGTATEAAYQEMIDVTIELQQLSGDPVQQFVAAQQELISTRKSANSPTEIARAESRVAYAKGAVELMQNNPVEFDANRSGTTPIYLDPAKLTTDEGRAELQEEMADRSVRVSALQSLYGDVVKMRPMQPEEAVQWSAVLNRSPHKERGEMIAFLRNSLPDDKAYFGLMQQISPDSPVTRHAGFVAARQASVVIENGFVRDTTQDTGDISGLMLLGEDLLNPSKTIQAGNGNAKAFPMPEQNEFDRKFSEEVGSVFGGNPTARSNAYLSVRAYYAGAASLQDKYDGELDTNLLKKAVRATLGEVVDFNSKGSVLAPLGMDSASFTTKAREVINSTLTDKGMPETYARYAFGLRNVQGGYVITKPDGTELVDNDGSALIVQVKP